MALDWAQHAPCGEIQNLVLINTSSAFSPPWQRMRPGAWPRILRLLAYRELFDRERAILALTSNRPVPLALAKRWYSIQRQRPVSLDTAFRQLRAAAGFRPRAHAPAAGCPVAGQPPGPDRALALQRPAGVPVAMDPEAASGRRP